MKITPIIKDNLEHFKKFITYEDAQLIEEGEPLLALGLVADDLEDGVNHAAGAICLIHDEYELKITSFYVSPDYRGRGAGKFLLDEAKRLFGKEYMEFDIEFLIYGKKEEKLANFLEAYGFEYADPEYEVLEIMVSDLEKSKLAGKKGEGEPFSKIPEKLFKISQTEALKNGAILPVDGLQSDSIEKDVSVGIVNDNKMDYFVVYEKLSDMVLLLSSFYAKDNNAATMLHMLEASAALIMDKYSGFAKIIIQPVNEVGKRLAGSVYEEARCISCRYRYVI